MNVIFIKNTNTTSCNEYVILKRFHYSLKDTLNALDLCEITSIKIFFLQPNVMNMTETKFKSLGWKFQSYFTGNVNFSISRTITLTILVKFRSISYYN